MNETLNKLNTLLKKFNNTFDLKANVIEDNGEDVANGFKIDKLKDDGSEFINELFDIVGSIVVSISNEHELIFNQEKGLVIAKKVVTVDYIIE
jgi:hypothetical protein